MFTRKRNFPPVVATLAKESGPNPRLETQAQLAVRLPARLSLDPPTSPPPPPPPPTPTPPPTPPPLLSHIPLYTRWL